MKLVTSLFVGTIPSIPWILSLTFFRKFFAWPRQKAEFHMLQVHNNGKSVLVRDSLEKAEHYVHQLQRYSLHATMERDN